MKHIWVFAGLLPLVVTGCTAEWIIPEDYYVECESNADCPDSAQCREAEDGTSVCVTNGREECGNGVRDGDELCDDGDDNTTDYGVAGRCNPDCDGYAPHCGDDVENGGESCDQGAANTDAYGIEGSCNLECTGLAPHCGDAIVNGGEVCDLGTDNNTDTYGGPNRCNTACTGFASHCGDNIQDATEACDDGNVLGDDYCAPDCSAVTTVCGDGIVAGDEVCDDGPSNADGYFPGTTAQCNSTCTGVRPYCGDGNRTDDEVCDAGTQNVDAESYSQNPSCTTSCDGFNKYCGDGEQDESENCDDGDLNSDQYEYYQHCNGSCTADYPAYCGDGLLQSNLGEACDDGNEITTDSCPSGPTGNCLVASCGDGFIYENVEVCELGETLFCQDFYEGFEATSWVCPETCRYQADLCELRPDFALENMVVVPAGNFWMGCNEAAGDGCLYHEVVYLDAFYIDITEVTAGAYKACVDAGMCEYNGPISDDNLDYYSEARTYNNNRDMHPINYVSWFDAKTYCEWLGKRLPTEAEWVKAARGTDGRTYPWGNEEPTCELAWYFDCLGETETTQPVGSLSAGASPYGAMDMAGNVWEWTADWYSSNYYNQTPEGGWVNPEGPVSGSHRVIRGGGAVVPFAPSNTLTLSINVWVGSEPDFGGADYGIRCAQ
jgi:formylglycine-generating enzyme